MTDLITREAAIQLCEQRCAEIDRAIAEVGDRSLAGVMLRGIRSVYRLAGDRLATNRMTVSELREGVRAVERQCDEASWDDWPTVIGCTELWHRLNGMETTDDILAVAAANTAAAAGDSNG